MRITEILNESEILDEITRPVDMYDADEVLNNSGYEQIGRGHFAKIYAKRGSDHVLKLFASHDMSYPRFVNMTIQNPNTHFPQFKGKMMKITDTYYAIRMEKLSPISVNSLDQSILKLMREYINHQVDDSFRPFPRMETMSRLEKMQPGITEACDGVAELLKQGGAISLDLHSGNVMKRGNTLVIIDPVS